MGQLVWEAANTTDPTFTRESSRSHIDVTLCSTKLIPKIKGWRVVNENPFTYHGHIYFELKSRKTGGKSGCLKMVEVDQQAYRDGLLKSDDGTNFHTAMCSALKTASRKNRERSHIGGPLRWKHIEADILRPDECCKGDKPGK